MTLSSLWAENFRNLAALDLTFSDRLNFIIGDNGAGKTNLLELIYFLGRTRPFRTHKAQQIIRHGQQGCMVRGKVVRGQGGPIVITVRRDESGTQVQRGNQPIHSIAELIPCLPLQVINPDSHQLLEGGPSCRRRYLDWGVFHVEHRFLSCWRRYSKALRQRNAALRQRSTVEQIRAWDTELVQAAMEIHTLRSAYVQQLAAPIVSVASQFLGPCDISLDYRPGWPETETLAEALKQSLESDRERGCTGRGPHRADLSVKLDGRTARDWVSRGQQKAIVISMLLAQAQAYSDSTSTPSLLLVDDLAAELDADRRARVLAVLRESNAQIFITALEPETWGLPGNKAESVFHVEHGRLSKMV